jgi:hypothetical protein
MTMELDRVTPVTDCSNATVETLIGLLEQTRSPEQCIYREAELEDLIRQMEAELRERETQALQALLAAAFEAHKLVADQEPSQAANRLRAAMQR